MGTLSPPHLSLSLIPPPCQSLVSLSLRAPLHPGQPWHCLMGGTLNLGGMMVAGVGM